jgi:amino acid transporter
MYGHKPIGHLTALASGPSINVPLAIILTLVVFFTMTAILLVYGLSTFLGIVLIGYAGITLLLNRGNYTDYIVIICMFAGIAFIILGFFGTEFAVIDMSQFSFARNLHDMFGI